ncbi:MAG: ABC transporter ATP-binding protein [Acholeplasmatales bacterium]|nr:MAG: ABC transporter ATP-binding protein [Acholeplasmatales bacterium]
MSIMSLDVTSFDKGDAQSMAFLELRNVSKRYGNLNALNDVSLSIKKGSVVGLLGPNGSGKTTMIKLITGMLRHYKGTVFLEGLPWSYRSKALISYLPDVFIFDGQHSVKGLMRYYRDMYPDFNELTFLSLLERFKIDRRGQFKQLSKGNKEKLQLAFVLAREADLYIFDEPIGGVDPVVREIILDTIMEFKQTDATVILATHQIHDVEPLFDEVIFLKEGSIHTHEDTKTLLSRSNRSLVDCFKEAFRDVH